MDFTAPRPSPSEIARQQAGSRALRRPPHHRRLRRRVRRHRSSLRRTVALALGALGVVLLSLAAAEHLVRAPGQAGFAMVSAALSRSAAPMGFPVEPVEPGQYARGLGALQQPAMLTAPVLPSAETPTPSGSADERVQFHAPGFEVLSLAAGHDFNHLAYGVAGSTRCALLPGAVVVWSRRGAGLSACQVVLFRGRALREG
ncbi:MAG: hypothetical protein AAGI34_03365, partial [Pseudomonadota bacterium]